MNKRVFLFCIVALAICLTAGGSLAYDGAADISRLKSDGTYIIDGHGRVVLLRGANVPAHCYIPNKFGAADLDALEEFGFNFIRLGISWDKAEPVEGQVDIEYIRSLVEFARLAGERGIYVMPEVHKYGWCAPGSDWPEWTCPYPVKDGGDFIPVMRNANVFWKSPDLQQKLLDFWKIIFVEFRDLDNVMGYNPMNEPLDITMMIPGVFDKKLFAFYERWIALAREMDPERPACLEPHTANMIIPSHPPPFNHDNLVYAPHPYYVHGDGFMEKESKRGLVKKYKRIVREAAELNAPLMIGEYGGDPETEYAREWLTTSWELMDQYFASAAIWVYDPSDSGWAISNASYEPKPFFAAGLNRPYPRYTAGKPIELKYSVEEREFTYRYAPDHSIAAPTVIYLPKELAKGDVSVDGGEWEYEDGASVMLVRASEGVGEVRVRASK